MEPFEANFRVGVFLFKKTSFIFYKVVGKAGDWMSWVSLQVFDFPKFPMGADPEAVKKGVSNWVDRLVDQF